MTSTATESAAAGRLLSPAAVQLHGGQAAAAGGGSLPQLLVTRLLHGGSPAAMPNGAEAKPSLGGMPASELKETGSGGPHASTDRDA